MDRQRFDIFEMSVNKRRHPVTDFSLLQQISELQAETLHSNLGRNLASDWQCCRARQRDGTPERI